MDWRRVMDINLTAVIEGTKLAVQAMKGRGGQILNVGSAAGLYPMQFGPLYTASKGGVVMFTRALLGLKQMGIRANALCPECQDGMPEAGWNDSNLSAKQIEAKVQERQLAALKRERALAYARTQQQLKRTSPKPVLPLFIECEVEKAHWGWSYMERWSSARPWESRIFENHSAFKDVADVSKSVDVSTTRNAKDTSSEPKHGNDTFAIREVHSVQQLYHKHIRWNRPWFSCIKASGGADGRHHRGCK